MRKLISLPLLALFWAAACAQESIQPDSNASGGTSSAGSPGASPAGTAGSGSSSTAGSSSEGGQAGSGEPGGQAGTNSVSSECTKATNLPGPPMVRVTTPSGKSYCIDSYEITQKDYSNFYEENKSGPLAMDPKKIHPQCEFNNFYPKVGSPEASCSVSKFHFLPEKYPDAPMSCVDWCDAKAYCEWAGKRLCGRVGGGAVSKEDMNNPNEDQWYNVCSMGGKSKYATGDKYQEGQCLDKSYLPIDPDKMSEEEIESRAEKKFTMGHKDLPNCHGTEAPFDQIYDINGGRSELTDACTGDGPNDQCFKRGGHLNSHEQEFDCTQSYINSRIEASPSTGFRCCLDE